MTTKKKHKKKIKWKYLKREDDWESLEDPES